MEFEAGRRESNYYSEEEDTHEALCHRLPFAIPPPPSSSSSFTSSFVEKEHMFDKVVTPSDVGKLNRLVIPKQHAERYFPLDASAGEKGLLLTFEDRAGKHWRFRYSYWNSSQSYVMTKGWSRFVKEKHLDAGDTVSFGRGVGEVGRSRFFIDWKRRPERGPPHFLLPCHPYHHLLPRPSLPSFARSGVDPWGRLVVPPPMFAMPVYDDLRYGYRSSTAASDPYLYLRSAGDPSQIPVQIGGDSGLSVPIVPGTDSPAVQGVAAAGKIVRLFGVNLGCCSSSEADRLGQPCGGLRESPAAISDYSSRPPGAGDDGVLAAGEGYQHSPARALGLPKNVERQA